MNFYRKDDVRFAEGIDGTSSWIVDNRHLPNKTPSLQIPSEFGKSHVILHSCIRADSP